MTKPRWMLLCCLAAGCNGPGAARVPSDPTSNTWAASLPALVNAGADRDVAPGSRVCLDGGSSYHPLGQGYILTWKQIAGEAVTLSDPTLRAPCFAAPVTPQSLQFSLSADDGAWVMEDGVSINVRPAPFRVAPVVRAGPDRFVDTNSKRPGRGDVAAADPNTTVTWEAAVITPTVGSPVTNILADAGIFRLDSAEGGLSGLPDYIMLWPDNGSLFGRLAPTAVVAAEQTRAPAAANITLDGSKSANGYKEAMRWRWSQTCGEPVFQASPDNSQKVVVQLPRRAQTLCFRVAVRDSMLESAPADVQIEVTAPADHLPVSAVPPPVLQVHAGNAVVISADPNDAAPPDATYTWRQTLGVAVSPAQNQGGPLLSFIAPPSLGPLAFEVFGANSAADGPIAHSVIAVVDPNINTSPAVTLCTPTATPQAGSTVWLYGSALDPEQDPLSPAVSWGNSPQNSVAITVEAIGTRPAECPLPRSRTGAPTQDYQASFVAPAAGTPVTLTVTVCDTLNACGAASVLVTPQ